MENSDIFNSPEVAGTLLHYVITNFSYQGICIISSEAVILVTRTIELLCLNLSGG